MSSQSDTPWSDGEKYFLLTEILKNAGIHSSHLLQVINDYGINPNWDDIPLPPGRSLNSCRVAFSNMQMESQRQQQQQHQHHQHQHHQHQRHQSTYLPAPSLATALAPAPLATSIPRPEMTGSTLPVDPTLRKRPYPDKPLPPRAIQPKPPTSTASISSESSAQLSPRLDSAAAGEPPRKRGRPSKAETERRKRAAEARGEAYPPPRRSNSNRIKIPPSPTSPGRLIPFAQSNIAMAQNQNQNRNPSSVLYNPPGRLVPVPNLSVDDRQLPNRSMGPNLRELPRPEIGHPLPSPHALQLGPPDSFPRSSNPGERSSFGALPPDRFSPDSCRRDSVTSRGEPTPYTERKSTTPGEKPR
ncbi:hypothetical protein N7495_008978 [Penicillium taxi]|uniref:uncharacterized protein n=1 Tax=Penicillium taxi TaxID=168475 RepID=UPI002545A494|nr:uncharacterized protein N7495_008978 [Penicillium taxi]KAJ5888937.1 hypothetical protein N7495_008978 [Penicillium taxi]